MQTIAARASKVHRDICTGRDTFQVPEVATEDLKDRLANTGEKGEEVEIHVNTGDSRS
jgi:hypothetical protein